MNGWQLTGFFALAGVVGIVLFALWLMGRFSQARQNERQSLEKAPKPSTERAKAQGNRVTEQAAERAAARAAERAATEAAAAEKALAEKAALEQAIVEWAAAEQAENERAKVQRTAEERRESEQLDARMRAVEDAISEWLDAERDGTHVVAVAAPGSVPTKKHTRAQAIHEQVRLTGEKVEKEMADLDFIKNRIEAGVDFLPLEFKLTIDQWKQGQILRHNTFDDLKLKFRYKAYSIEDGYELLYRYTDWLEQQRQKLRLFIKLLGTEPDSAESIQASIERAEHRERQKYLEMDVEVIFALRDIRSILEKLIEMETILRQLEEVCHKRSEQIIAPSWESKGSL